MEDIVPELYKRIKSEFDGLVSSDEEIQAILNGKKDVSFAVLASISRRIGDYAAKSLSDCYKEAELPEETLYWNIMERTIIPLMMEVHRIVNDLASCVQKRLDEKQKIGIKPQEADFPTERIKSVMNMISHLNTEENIYDRYGEDNKGITFYKVKKETLWTSQEKGVRLLHNLSCYRMKKHMVMKRLKYITPQEEQHRNGRSCYVMTSLR